MAGVVRREQDGIGNTRGGDSDKRIGQTRDTAQRVV